MHASRLPGNSGWGIAFVIAGHHAGLSNLTKLKSRLREKSKLLDAAKKGGAPPELFSSAVDGLLPDFSGDVDSPENMRRFALWIRMLFSTLVDADFLDTERFYDSSRAQLRTSTWLVASLLGEGRGLKLAA